MHAIQTVAVIVIGLAFLSLIGTCGSLECNVITFGQADRQFIISTLIALACTAVSKRLKTIEEFMHRNDKLAQERLVARERRR